MEKIRLQKVISQWGLMSRRHAEAEIARGAITVNGIPASLGDKVDPDADQICWNGKPISGESAFSAPVYILLNKPVGFVTTMSDEQGRHAVSELIGDVGVRVYPVGRLDQYSDGLLLCTNDGELANRIAHPSHRLAKNYLAVITTHLTEEDVRALAEPIVLDGYPLRPFETALISYTTVQNTPATVVRFTLYEGRNREIRKICAHHNLRLARLTRVSIGDLTLDGIPAGKWRTLTEDEIEYLKSI